MIGTALVGFGWWGQHIARRLKDHPDFDLKGVVEPAAALHADIKALGLQVYNSYDDAVAQANVDAIILTSPNDLHDTDRDPFDRFADLVFWQCFVTSCVYRRS